jgi:hypothetical protein
MRMREKHVLARAGFQHPEWWNRCQKSRMMFKNPSYVVNKGNADDRLSPLEF